MPKIDALTKYQERLLRSLKDSLENANRLMERDTGEHPHELMQRLPSIRTQLAQAAAEASELYGAMSQYRYPES